MSRALVGTTAIVLSLAAAAPASGAIHRFEGSDGTTCTVEVGAKASDSLGALSGPPQVGYSSFPECTYPARPASGPKGKAKSCRKAKRGGKGKGRRRCKRPKPRTYAAAPAEGAAVAAASPLAALDHARLTLLSPGGGVASVGDATAAAPALGYSCSLSATSACGDSGRLVPALPGVTYTAEFSLNLSPPAGETWVSRPAGCSGGAVADCVLHSAGVTPDL